MNGGERPGTRDLGPSLRPRERILNVSVRLFLEDGIRAVGVHRIVDEAGVALMMLYRHFGDKDGLIVAALEQWSTEAVGWLTDQVDRCGDDPEAAVRRTVGGVGAAPRRRGQRRIAGRDRGRPALGSPAAS
jgi:AcrR family transcriptional regulator